MTIIKSLTTMNGSLTCGYRHFRVNVVYKFCNRILSQSVTQNVIPIRQTSRSQWPRCLRNKSAGVHLLRSWVRIPTEAWMSVCCDCCVLSGRGLCDELITRPEESYRLWCVVVCDLETARMRRPWLMLGRSAAGKKYDKGTFFKRRKL